MVSSGRFSAVISCCTIAETSIDAVEALELLELVEETAMLMFSNLKDKAECKASLY
jgi:hypothetical protein